MSFKHGYSNELSIIYTVYARFTPINDQDWSDKKKMISSFMGSKDITIDRPPSTEPDEPVDYRLKSSVGGFIGISKTKCNTEIHIDKKEFYMGESIAIRLRIDNSNCEKDVKNVKVRIQETRKGTTNKHLIIKTHKAKSSHFDKKDTDRVLRGETAEKVIYINVGSSDSIFNSIKPSINGRLISITHELQIFVKHDAWNEWGKGKVVSQPILIKRKPAGSIADEYFRNRGMQNPLDTIATGLS